VRRARSGPLAYRRGVTTGRSEDEAWQAIVDNYGERAVLDDDPPADPRPEPPAPTSASDLEDLDDEPEERFVPPPPPPAPRLPWQKRLAWLAVLGTPVALVLILLLSVYVPPLVGYGLVAGFVGGFCYLVATMQRAEERDPWDDGAQI